jgi:hypothetical protein
MMALKRLVARAGLFWVEVVLGWGAELLLFWAETGWLSEATARKRMEIAIRGLERMRHASKFASMLDIILDEDKRLMKSDG